MSTLGRKLRRDIANQRAQFIAVGITVLLGITMFAASYDSFQNLEASYDQTAVEARFANLTVVGGDISSFADVAAATDGVEAVDTRTVVDVPFDVPGTRLLGRVVGIPGDQQVNQLTVQSGALPTGSDVAVEAHLADHFGIDVGSTIGILGTDGWVNHTVSGIVASAEYIWPAKSSQDVLTSTDNFGVVFATQTETVTIAGTDVPNQAVVYYDGGDPNEALTSDLTAAASGAVDVFTRDQQPSNAALSEDLAGFEELALFFPVLFLSASGMAAWVMLTRLVQAQRSQVGILLANGFTRRQVLRHYLGYGLVPGVIGAVIGAVAGTLLSQVITRMYTRMLAIPVTVIEWHPFTAVGAVILGVAAMALAAYGPARSAARIAPAESMRGVVPTGGGRPSLLERLIPAVGHLPIRWRMGLRGIERNPRRTISTVLGVVLSLVLVLVSWGMIDTIQQLMNRQFDSIDRQDARVYFAGPVDESAVEALAAVDGIARVEPSLQVPASVSGADGPISVGLVVLPEDTRMHGFYTADGSAESLTSDGALVAAGVLDSTGLSVGDTLDLTVSGLGNVEVPIAGSVDEPLGTFVYLDFAEASDLAGVSVPATAALVDYDGTVDAAAIKQSVLAVDGVAAYEDTEALANLMRDYMGLFYAFVGVMLAFGGAMAFALIFNAMSVNIAERTREVGTLMAVGVDRTTISRLITVENLTVALIGVPLGLIGGYLVSDAAMKSFDSEMFRMHLDMRPTTLLFSALAILVVAFLSQRPGLAAIRRMDVARIIKDRSS